MDTTKRQWPKKQFQRDLIDQLPDVLTLYEVSKTFGITYRTVRLWQRDFEFPTFRIDTENGAKRRKFSKADFVRFLLKTKRIK